MIEPDLPDVPEGAIASCYVAVIGYLDEHGKMKYGLRHSDSNLSTILGLMELAKLDLHATAQAEWEDESGVEDDDD